MGHLGVAGGFGESVREERQVGKEETEGGSDQKGGVHHTGLVVGARPTGVMPK